MQVILDSPFARPGSAPIGGGKNGEFRDWTRPHTWSITHIYYKRVVIARVLLTAFTSFSFLFSSFLRILVFARLQRLLASAIFLCFVLEVDCGCNVRGSLNNSCDPVTRQCFCKVRVTHTVRMYVEGRSLDYWLVNLVITSNQTIRPAFKAASTLRRRKGPIASWCNKPKNPYLLTSVT